MVDMRRSGKVSGIGLVLVSLTGVAFLRSRAYGLYFDQMSLDNWLIAAAGWCLATYGPILVTLWLWRLTKMRHISWIIHIALLPSLFALLVVGERIMLSTLYSPDFDSTLGAPIMPALLAVLAAATIYYSALMVERRARFQVRPNGK